jgi:hypothetical protein
VSLTNVDVMRHVLVRLELGKAENAVLTDEDVKELKKWIAWFAGWVLIIVGAILALVAAVIVLVGDL